MQLLLCPGNEYSVADVSVQEVSVSSTVGCMVSRIWLYWTISVLTRLRLQHWMRALYLCKEQQWREGSVACMASSSSADRSRQSNTPASRWAKQVANWMLSASPCQKGLEKQQIISCLFYSLSHLPSCAKVQSLCFESGLLFCANSFGLT